jgi:hypothetical protein
LCQLPAIKFFPIFDMAFYASHWHLMGGGLTVHRAT